MKDTVYSDMAAVTKVVKFEADMHVNYDDLSVSIAPAMVCLLAWADPQAGKNRQRSSSLKRKLT